MTPEGDLQFDSVVPGTDGAAAVTACTVCRRPLEDEYFDVGGQQICRWCSQKLAYETATPRGMSTLVRGRGGRRYQVLALVLTYWAIGLAYSSLAIKASCSG